MAEAVVDVLEPVQVHEEHGREGPVAGPRPLERAPQTLDQIGSVGQAGERLECPLFRDVGVGAGDAHRLAGAVLECQGATAHVRNAPVPALNAVFVLDMRRLAAEMGVDGGLELVAVLGMHAAEPILRDTLELIRSVAQHRLPLGAKVDGVRGEVPVPPAVGDPLLEWPLLRNARRLLRKHRDRLVERR